MPKDVEGGDEGWIAWVKGWQRLDLTGKGAAKVGSFREGQRRLDRACGWPGLDHKMTRVGGYSMGRDGVGKDGGMSRVEDYNNLLDRLRVQFFTAAT
ncbi:hypothetical protein TIFTF001_028074 [Ficus carica]|uniref:Uncharacterized protein n=1 Tax=Ficus carica TaxID=3494 RepID=A0AA88DQC3_FICCA|nr:hypothetical protein TIFTF001_028074 [Ficus carica]